MSRIGIRMSRGRTRWGPEADTVGQPIAEPGSRLPARHSLSKPAGRQRQRKGERAFSEPPPWERQREGKGEAASARSALADVIPSASVEKEICLQNIYQIGLRLEGGIHEFPFQREPNFGTCSGQDEPY